MLKDKVAGLQFHPEKSQFHGLDLLKNLIFNLVNMLKKRLIGVITVLDGMAVQSIGFKKYYLLGGLQYWLKTWRNGAQMKYLFNQ